MYDIKTIIFWIIYILWICIVTEIFAYYYHKYVSHGTYITSIHNTHKKHHNIHLDVGHESNEDFIWLLLLIIIVQLLTGLGILSTIISDTKASYFLIGISTSIVIFYWNWWIHCAYHQDGHWLNYYNWFQKEKEKHYIHHYDPHKNYGIASHFCDKLMGTYVDSLSEIL